MNQCSVSEIVGSSLAYDDVQFWYNNWLSSSGYLMSLFVAWRLIMAVHDSEFLIYAASHQVVYNLVFSR